MLYHEFLWHWVLAGRKMNQRQGGSKHGLRANYHQDHRISARIQNVRTWFCLFEIWRNSPDSPSSELSIKALGHADLDVKSRFRCNIETLTVIVSEDEPTIFVLINDPRLASLDQDAKSTFYAETCVTMRMEISTQKLKKEQEIDFSFSASQF